MTRGEKISRKTFDSRAIVNDWCERQDPGGRNWTCFNASCYLWSALLVYQYMEIFTASSIFEGILPCIWGYCSVGCTVEYCSVTCGQNGNVGGVSNSIAPVSWSKTISSPPWEPPRLEGRDIGPRIDTYAVLGNNNWNAKNAKPKPDFA